MSATISIDPLLLLESKLRAAVEDKLAKGWTIDPQVAYIETHKKCCLLGAQIHSSKEFFTPYRFLNHRDIAANRLQIPNEDAFQLETGFMNHKESGNPASPYWQLGNQLRKEYVK